MMDIISEALGAASPVDYAQAAIQEMEVKALDLKDTIKHSVADDYQFSRKHMRTAIEQCVNMLPGLVGLAKVAESPAMYSSAANVFKVLSDMNTALIESAVKIDKVANVKQVAGSAATPQAALQAPQGDAGAEEGAPQGDIVFNGQTPDLLNALLAQASIPKVIPPSKVIDAE